MADTNKVTRSCWQSEKITTGTVEKTINCFECNGQTQEVKSITVKHFVKSNLIDHVYEGKYYICMNENCDVVYFSEDKKAIFTTKDLNTPIWFKKDADPKYICYCNHVTEQQIIDAVQNDGAKNMKDIVRLTGAMKHANCEVNNPLSTWCGPVIQSVIDKALKS